MPAKRLPRRSSCPLSCALDLLGDRWTMLVIRDAFLGKHHFEEFLASPEGIATNILTARLRLLCDQGILSKQPDKNDGRRYHYHLTPRGQSLSDVLVPLARWGLAHVPGTKAMIPLPDTAS